MTIIVCGGRDFSDYAYLSERLNTLEVPCGLTVVHGDARGADRLAARWAKENGYEAIAVPAEWELHGNAAGPLRNRKMLDDYPVDMVIAFPGGRGTMNMITQAVGRGINTWFVGNP